ncbi:GRAM domain-containing protein 2A-like isoform X1 [Aphidius gifuensis]|uniref:GRAM domain-containing protein 2A-like isoform X1 n=1 Tax=Aphidius gifuensis TaxID=684658 RepID=UPI001CDCC330|nr:GRAM domain-containing protein 2A-like isoform X1 [Aphidius gifuensis]
MKLLREKIAQLKPHTTSTPIKTSNKKSTMSVNDSSVILSSSNPSNSRQKKFYRHFTEISSNELIIDYYNCALDGDILRQGHLYITKNYFAFYSNLFGNITKILLPITLIKNITKEKIIKIFSNTITITTENNDKYIFCSLLSRDSTFKLMMQVWNKKNEEKANLLIFKEPEFLHHDDNNLATDNEKFDSSLNTQNNDNNLSTTAIVYADLDGSSSSLKNYNLNSTTNINENIEKSSTTGIFEFLKKHKLKSTTLITILIALLVALYISAAFMMLRIDKLHTVYINHPLMSQNKLTHDHLIDYLNTNLDQIVKVRESLQLLSDEFLSMSQKFNDASQTSDQTGKPIDSSS